MRYKLTKRDFIKGMAAGLTSASLMPWFGYSVYGDESRGDAMNDDTSYFIQTVRGRIKPSQLGLTLIHEHIMVDFIGADKASKDRYDVDEVFEVMLPYLREIKALGVTGFAECTPMFLARDADLLKRLSGATDMHILTNTGLYRDQYVPKYAFDRSADELAAMWIDEIRNGIEDTGIKPGFIKIAANTGKLVPIQKKIIRAAARTSLATGTTIASHTTVGVSAVEEIDILEEEGLPLSKFIWVHASSEGNQDLHFAAAERGAWVEYDNISKGSAQNSIQRIKNMLEKGYGDKLLLSQDAGWYHVGEPKGGNIKSFAYIIEEFVPLMKQSGIDQDTVDQLLIQNPARAMRIPIKPGKSEGVSPAGKAISTFGRTKNRLRK